MTQKKNVLIHFIILLVGCISTCCCHGSRKALELKEHNETTTLLEDIKDISQDQNDGKTNQGTAMSSSTDSIQPILSDSICEIMERADTLNLYLMKQTIITNDSSVTPIDTIANYPYIKKDTISSKFLIDVLRFILTDKDLFINDGSIVKQPYSPYLTAEFVDGERKIAFQFSFGSYEIGISTDKEVLRYQVVSWHQIARWCILCMPEDKYINSLN